MAFCKGIKGIKGDYGRLIAIYSVLGQICVPYLMMLKLLAWIVYVQCTTFYFHFEAETPIFVIAKSYCDTKQ